jgi:hypothetical protein
VPIGGRRISGAFPALTRRRSSASQPNVSYLASFAGFFLATSRVFEFFKIAPPERVGFAKHREAAEKKAAAVAAAEADAEEMATSPRIAPQKTGRRSAHAAATAAAEGKAGRGPAHVRGSGPLCGLEGFLVNNASTRGSEENNHEGLGGK